MFECVCVCARACLCVCARACLCVYAYARVLRVNWKLSEMLIFLFRFLITKNTNFKFSRVGDGGLLIQKVPGIPKFFFCGAVLSPCPFSLSPKRPPKIKILNRIYSKQISHRILSHWFYFNIFFSGPNQFKNGGFFKTRNSIAETNKKQINKIKYNFSLLF